MKKNKDKNIFAKSFKKYLIESVELPSEIVLNIPLINILGDSKILIENFKNIAHYSSEVIKIDTSCGILKITGQKLFLKEFNKNKILIKGKLDRFEFI